MLGVGEKSVCNTCHGQGEDALAVTGKMRGSIDQLVASLNRSTEILNRAERAGMEVSRAKFDLNEARDSLTHARVMIHSFSNEELSKVVEPGMAVAHVTARAATPSALRRRTTFPSRPCP